MRGLSGLLAKGYDGYQTGIDRRDELADRERTRARRNVLEGRDDTAWGQSQEDRVYGIDKREKLDSRGDTAWDQSQEDRTWGVNQREKVDKRGDTLYDQGQKDRTWEVGQREKLAGRADTEYSQTQKTAEINAKLQAIQLKAAEDDHALSLLLQPGKNKLSEAEQAEKVQELDEKTDLSIYQMLELDPNAAVDRLNKSPFVDVDDAHRAQLVDLGAGKMAWVFLSKEGNVVIDKETGTRMIEPVEAMEKKKAYLLKKYGEDESDSNTNKLVGSTGWIVDKDGNHIAPPDNFMEKGNHRTGNDAFGLSGIPSAMEKPAPQDIPSSVLKSLQVGVITEWEDVDGTVYELTRLKNGDITVE